MRTPILLAKAKGFLTALKIWKVHAEFPSRFQEQPIVPSPLAPEEQQKSLEAHLFEHLAAYSELQALLALGTPFDQLRQSREVVQDAKSLAAQIAAIPGYEKIEPLIEAHYALVEHWRSSWCNGAVSVVGYRTRLKGLILFIRSQCQPQSDAQLMQVHATV